MAEAAVLTAEAGYGVEVRLKVADSSGTLQDISSYALNVRYEASWDTPISQCTVECARTVNGASLAPDDSTSSLNALGPLLAHWRLFTLEVAVVPLGQAHSLAVWREEFRGRLDDFTVGDDTVSLKVLDEGIRLRRAQVNAERTYGSDAGTAVQTVMASILSDNGVSWASVTTPTSPGWLLQKYKQDKVSVLDALRKLAEQIGWEVRYWYNTSTGKVDQLRFFEPDRAKVTADFTFGPTGPCAYLESPEFRTTGEDLANYWVGIYSDLADLDAARVPKRKTVTRADGGSIAANDTARAEVAEASTSNINTQAEMERLLDAGLADCKDPKVVGSLPVPYFPWVELGDVIGVLANGASLNQDVLLAVEAYSHEIPLNGVPTTTLSFRGTKPTTSLVSWARRQARPAMFSNTNPANENVGPAAPTSLSTEPTVGGFRLRWNPPTTGPEAAAYELHVSTSSGFTPSDSTRRWVGAGTEALLADLTPGTTYYAKLVPRTSLTGGDRGTASSEVSFTPRYVEPRILQRKVSYAVLPMNADWEARNDSTAPPDAWEMRTGTWATDVNEESSTVFSGARALRFASTSVAAKLVSEYFIIRSGDIITGSAIFYGGLTAYVSGNDAGLYIEMYEANFALSRTVTLQERSTATADWLQLSGVVIASFAECYARLVVGKKAATAYEVIFDSVRVQVAQGPENEIVPSFSNGWVNASGAPLTASYYRDATRHVHMQGTISSGTVGSAAFTLPAGYRPLGTVTFVTFSGVGTPAYITISSAGVVTVQSGATASLDGITFRAYN